MLIADSIRNSELRRVREERRKKGSDRWGRYYDFTGHEEKGYCFWCGRVVKNRRYCNKECQRQYFNHFFWSDARDWCLERYHNTCQGCGSKKSLDVHHIVPVKASGYGWNILNDPKNLIPLCVKCHGEVRNKLKSERRLKCH